MKRNRRSERHHFVPQFYLRHWCNHKDRLWVHPMDGKQPYESRANSVAFERGLYSTEDLPDIQN
ncbi:DUF4238 domain-containing protein [Luteolibacter yonseiensis]